MKCSWLEVLCERLWGGEAECKRDSEGWWGCGMLKISLFGSQGITKESRLCSGACFDTLVDSPILSCGRCLEECVQKKYVWTGPKTFPLDICFSIVIFFSDIKNKQETIFPYVHLSVSVSLLAGFQARLWAHYCLQSLTNIWTHLDPCLWIVDNQHLCQPAFKLFFSRLLWGCGSVWTWDLVHVGQVFYHWATPHPSVSPLILYLFAVELEAAGFSLLLLGFLL